MRILVNDIISFLGSNMLECHGETANVYVDNIADVNHLTFSSLDWINTKSGNAQQRAEESPAKVILASPAVKFSTKMDIAQKVLMIVERPRMSIAKIIQHFFIEKKVPKISSAAFVNEQAKIGNNVYIGPGCVIGNATIGNNTIINPNVVVYDDVIIGNDCIIQAGAVLGTDGLGCSREQDGKLVKFPHIGKLIIGNDVEIGANCQIAKGVLSDTIIEDGCKINGLSFIAHNCHLEENVWITGDTMLCGSTYVGRNTTIYSNVIIREQVKIGTNSTIGMGSVVTKNVPNDEIWLGSPAHFHSKK